MNMKKAKRLRRHSHIIRKLKGLEKQARVIVFRSNTNFYIQLIDDTQQKVLTGISTLSKEFKEKYTGKSSKSIEAAAQLGVLMSEKCKKLKIKHVVFDRNGYKYHGRIKVLADTLRKKGLKF